MSYIVTDESKCKSCYLCVDICPKGLLKKDGKTGKTGQPVVRFDDSKKECLACAQCASVCPDLAITKVIKE